MVRIDWSKYPKDTTIVDLMYKRITEMNWDHAPPNLTEVHLICNEIREMNWKNAPQQLTTVLLNHNQISEMNWDHSPRELKKVSLSRNQITNINWKNVPDTLERVHGYQQEFEEYKAARRIQRVYLRHYTRRKAAARKIVEGCHNWVWKPKCKDGTIGIRPRLDTLELGLIN
jgi:Leucine-rich repeat (LRR) protein